MTNRLDVIQHLNESDIAAIRLVPKAKRMINLRRDTDGEK